MRGCALIALCIAAFVSMERVIAAPLTSGVWGKEGWNCGGPRCTQQDIRTGNARLVFDGLRLEVHGHRLCGIWYSHGGKLYRGFLKGRVLGARYELSFGPEIDHNPDYVGIPSLSTSPGFTAESVGQIRPRARQVVVVWGGEKQEQVLHRLSMQQMRRHGLVEYQPLEKEFLAACQSEASRRMLPMGEKFPVLPAP